MERFIALFSSGVADGAIDAIAALGFLVIFKASGVVNFAQGDLITLAAYVAVWFQTDHKVPWYWTYPIVIVIMALVGMMLERIAVAPLRKRPVFVVVIATLGAALAIRSGILQWQGSDPVSLSSPLTGKLLHVGGAVISYQRVAIVVVTVLVIGLMLWMFSRTSLGRELRAVASDPEMARVYGIRTNRLSLVAWAISGMLAGVAAILIGPLGAIDSTLGFNVMLTGFAAAVLGGFGNLKGVAVAGLLLGLVHQLLGGYLLQNYKDVYPFVLLVLVIAVRPEGLFASDDRARV